ncbi:MAG: hypothetical protein DHS20C02_04200 [Micavibrio sp.]|nr:MAG: hypothetical protein DHS20C02_04200 [Micavibrio sp.]
MTWRGPGHTYDYPSASSKKMTRAHQMSRWLPFKDEPMAYTVMAPGAKNQSGQSWEAVHAGVKSAAISDNFRKS